MARTARGSCIVWRGSAIRTGEYLMYGGKSTCSEVTLESIKSIYIRMSGVSDYRVLLY